MSEPPRLTYACLIVVAISTGLLIGLDVLGVSLPGDLGGRAVPLWCDVIAAGVAVACYGIFFSSPLNMLPWPVAAGTGAHALRWFALTAFWLQCSNGCDGCMSRRWHDHRTGFAPLAHAVRGHWLRLGGLIRRFSCCNAGRLPGGFDCSLDHAASDGAELLGEIEDRRMVFKLKQMIPSYGQSLIENAALCQQVRAETAAVLMLHSRRFVI